MDNLEYQYLAEEFSPERSDEYVLLARVTPLNFSYAVIGHNKLLLLSKEHELNDLNDEMIGLFKQFGQSVIGLVDNGFTFVPLAIFNPNKIGDFARYLDVKFAEKVFSQPFDIINQLIYKVDERIAAITDQFEPGSLAYASGGWIKLISNHNPTDNNLYLDIQSESVDILNFKGGKLRFYNHFECNNPDELAYFACVVTDELQLSPQSATLILSGDVNTGDANSTRLAEFFGKVELNQLEVASQPEQYPSHALLSLTALALCGSSVAH